jgi:hypothetical protein
MSPAMRLSREGGGINHAGRARGSISVIIAIPHSTETANVDNVRTRLLR